MMHSFTWESPFGGTKNQITLFDNDVAEAERRAKEMGWPGHGGGLLNYLADGLSSAWRRHVRRTKAAR